MAFVQKSIITMALGLDNMQRAICPANKPGLCPEMLPVNGSILLQHLMNVSFSFLDEEVYFDEQGDPPGKYEILNFRRRRPSASTQAADGSDWVRPQHGEHPDTAPADYSPADLAAPGAGQQQRRYQHPLYDSYSTLKVFRSGAGGAGAPNASSPGAGSGRGLAAVQQARRQRRQIDQPTYGYGSTSAGYEYVHVGSWKSSDGLSLFGEIQWPSRSAPDGQQQQQQQLGPLAAQQHELAPTGELAAANQFGLHHHNGAPKSVCSLPCTKGHAKVSYGRRARVCMCGYLSLGRPAESSGQQSITRRRQPLGFNPNPSPATRRRELALAGRPLGAHK